MCELLPFPRHYDTQRILEYNFVPSPRYQFSVLYSPTCVCSFIVEGARRLGLTEVLHNIAGSMLVSFPENAFEQALF